MHIKNIGLSGLVILILGAGWFSVALAQGNEDQVRGGFLSTRPQKQSISTKKPLPTRPKSTDTTSVSTTSSTMKLNALGIGYTIFMRDANGRAVRVDPSREFHSGDAIRIVMEPNSDGFLYIFHTENNSNPVMLFPDPRLQAGNNAIRAHVPYEVPSSTDSISELRWFVFEGESASERVFLVVTRQPLSDIPTGEKLMSYCQAKPDACPWKPTVDMWTKLTKEANNPLIVSKSKTQGLAQTSVEKSSVTRSLGLPKTAPAPSVICMNPTSDKGNLIAVIDLTHK